MVKRQPEYRKTKSTKQNILDAIEILSASKGYPPTFREVADWLGISLTACNFHLVKMRDQGMVAWTDNNRRTLTKIGDRKHETVS